MWWKIVDIFRSDYLRYSYSIALAKKKTKPPAGEAGGFVVALYCLFYGVLQAFGSAELRNAHSWYWN